VDDATWVERALFRWFSKRSYRASAIAPVVVFFLVLASGISLVSAVAARTPSDPYVAWIIVVGVLAAMALYLTALFSLAGFLDGSRRYKLLQLHQTIAEIRAMNWRDFEDLVAAYLEERGFHVDHTGRDSADGGVDIVARKNGTLWLVQCKHYRDDWVGVRPARELLGLVQHRKANGGILVSCGAFDRAATEFVKSSREIRLVGGEKLKSLVEQAVQNRSAKAVAAARPPA
jgi:HJR/Mrr/RecB family endonuclease